MLLLHLYLLNLPKNNLVWQEWLPFTFLVSIIYVIRQANLPRNFQIATALPGGRFLGDKISHMAVMMIIQHE